jgi:hypothetical protein
MFRSQSDPARWGTFPAAALMFHRADVSRGRNEVHVIHTPEDMVTPRPDTQHARYTNQRYLTFLSKVRTGFATEKYRAKADVALACGASAEADIDSSIKAIRLPDTPWENWLYPKFVQQAKELGLPGYQNMQTDDQQFDADTGELSLNYSCGLLTINTPRTQAVIGSLAEAEELKLDAVTVTGQTEFATVTATSLDGQPLGRARRVLVTAVGRAENTAQGFAPPTEQQVRWNPTSWMLPAEGRLPVIVEPIRAEVKLRAPGPATVYRLDATGKRTGEIPCNFQDGLLSLRLDNALTIWCEIVVP